MNDDSERISRRTTIVKAGGLVAAALGAGAWNLADSAEGGGPAGVASGRVKCVLTPEQTEGPYFLDGDRVRRNVTEGRPGLALNLRLGVVDASTCRPVKGAAVDIWHCDAGGDYSGVQGSSGTFLRGIQRTNASGVAVFDTIYPGWYPGRTVHIHVKVLVAGNVVHTGQLYFSDQVTDAVYKHSPYNKRPARDPRNSGDSIYRNGGSRSSLALRKSGQGYIGSITMGVSR